MDPEIDPELSGSLAGMGVATEELLEREAELDELRAAAERARGDAGELIVIEGAPGIGKTALLRAACEQAQGDGLRVLRARGAELEREFPYGLARQLCEPALAAADPETREALFAGTASAVRPLLLAGETLPLPPMGGDASFPLLNGLYWLVAGLAERDPLLLAVDDAHWGDGGSLRFLDFLARRLDGVPILLVVAARPAEPGADSSAVARLVTEHGPLVLRPATLSERAVGELVRATLGQDAAEELCKACHEASGGNPFALRDLLAELQAEDIEPAAAEASSVAKVKPKALTKSVRLRLSRLPDAARELARAVAVLGDGAELRDAASLAGLDPDSAAEAADALAECAILEADRELSFVHPLLRSAIYGELSRTERSRAHRAAARLLSERGADPDQIAVHLLATDPAGDPLTVESLLDAARRALQRSTNDAAVTYLARAWEEPPLAPLQVRVLRMLILACSRAGNLEMIETFREAFLAALIGDPDVLVDSAKELGVSAPIASSSAEELALGLFAAGRIEEASSLLAQGVLAARAKDENGVALRLEVQRMQIDYAVPAELVARMEPYRWRIEPGSPAERLWLGTEAWRTMLTGEDASKVSTLARRALEGWTLCTEALMLPIQLVVALTEAEDFDFAERTIKALEGVARALGSVPMAVAIVDGCHSQLAFRRGRISDASSYARSGWDLARRHGFAGSAPMYLAWSVDILVEREELDLADIALEKNGMTGNVPDQIGYTPILYSRATLKAAQGRPREALADLMEIRRRGERDGMEIIPWHSDAAILLAGLGDDRQARELAELGLERAKRWGTPGRIGRALRATGLVEGDDRGIERLREAVDVLAPSGAVLEHMHTLTELGAALRRANRRAEAREPLRQALEMARAGGAFAIARRAHDELTATGEKLRPLTQTGVDSLTPQERRVADLASQGLSNRDIAQSLFLTVKTVETHLTNAYRKLEIRSRKDLPTALTHSTSTPAR